MKVTIQPEHLKNIRISKHRNSKNKSVQFVDPSGKVINGHPIRHFINQNHLQRARFDTKFEAFSLLSQPELKDLFTNLPKDKVKGNTDKAALIQAYYNSCFNTFKAQSEADLKAIVGVALDNLNLVEKQALIDAKDILTKTKETQNV